MLNPTIIISLKIYGFKSHNISRSFICYKKMQGTNSFLSAYLKKKKLDLNVR